MKTTRTAAEETEFQAIRDLYQCDSIWSRYQELARLNPFPFPSLLQSAEDERREAINEREEWNSRDEEPKYSLRDDGRNPDGTGESYGERQ